MTYSDLLLYAMGSAILVITPGPVVVAIVARAASRGVRSSVPLALGVSFGDIVWPIAAVLGLAALVHTFEGAMTVLRYGGALVLIWMGISLWRSSGKVEAQAGLDESGWAGFFAGLGVIFGNPKAVIYYLGVLPAIFDIDTLSLADLAIICAVSAVVPFIGNMVWAVAAARARRLLKSDTGTRRLDQISGAALVGVGVVIAAT
ncbi:MAG: LysE family translocator [Pseudomonadota bacterium]